MAALTAVRAKHATLTTTTVDTITFSGNGDAIIVTNRSGASVLSFTLDGTTPTSLGDDTYVVPAVAGASKQVVTRGKIVKVIGSANDYSVELVPVRR